MLYKKPSQNIITFGVYDKEELPSEIKILVWNTHKNNHKMWPLDFVNFASKADILFLQELCFKGDIKHILEGSKICFNFAPSFQNTRGDLCGICIASSAQARQVTTNNLFCEPLLKTPKMIMHALFNVAGVEVLCINIHALNFKGLLSFRRQLESLDEILSSFKGPVIFAGDFNTWSGARASFLKTFCAHFGLSEVIFPTYGRKKFLGKDFDYIFTRGFEVLKARSIVVKTSDHNPLQIKLKILKD